MTRARSDVPGSDASTASDADDVLVACVEAYAETEECTLFPADAPADELVTTWMTAVDDAFVDLAEWR